MALNQLPVQPGSPTDNPGLEPNHKNPSPDPAAPDPGPGSSSNPGLESTQKVPEPKLEKEDISHGEVRRGFGARTFEEEKQRILLTARRLLPESGSAADSLEMLEDFIDEFEVASSEVKSDRETALAAVSTHGRALEHCSKALRSDPEVILTAMATFPPAVCWAGRAFFCSKRCVLQAQQQFAGTFQFASKELRADRDTALQAVKCFGEALQSASEELRGDREVVLAAVSNASRALEFASDELKKDREIVMAALKTQAFEETPHANILKHASPELWGDREVVLAAVRCVGKAIELTTQELKQDKDFVLQALRRAPFSEKMLCYEACVGAGDALHFKHMNEFLRAANSWLGCRGEVAHVLTVTLLDDSGQDSDPNGGGKVGEKFVCEVNTLSGTHFTCHLPPQTSSTSSSSSSNNNTNDRDREVTPPSKRAKWDPRIGYATGHDGSYNLEDLARLLRMELEEYQQVESHQRVVIVFQLGEDESVSVHAWDWARPLREFVRAS